MRLIDANELMGRVNSVPYLRKLKAKMLMEECKTYDAIPIDWLTRNYCAAGVFASPSYHKRADIVRQIIRDYKREQEQMGETE